MWALVNNVRRNVEEERGNTYLKVRRKSWKDGKIT